MEIIKNINNEEINFALVGRLDTTTAPSLDAAIAEVMPSAKKIIFDFAQLEYLSSAGLRVILSTQKTIAAKNGEFIIRHVNDTIMDVFDMTGFTSILTIEK